MISNITLKLSISNCVPFSLSVKELSSLDNDQMSWEIDTPSESGRSNKNLNLLIDVELFDELSILVVETGMMEADSEDERQLEVLITHLVLTQMRHLHLVHVEPLFGVHIARKERYKIECR